MPTYFAKEMTFYASKYWKLDSSVFLAWYFMPCLATPIYSLLWTELTAELYLILLKGEDSVGLCVHISSQFTNQKKKILLSFVTLTDWAEEKQDTKARCLDVDQKEKSEKLATD